MIDERKMIALYEIQIAMSRNQRKDFRYSYVMAADIDISANIYYRTKDEDTICWFLYALENISLSDLNIIKDRIKADLERIGTGTAINEIKKELPLEKSGDVDIKAFLQEFKENQNDNEKA